MEKIFRYYIGSEGCTISDWGNWCKDADVRVLESRHRDLVAAASEFLQTCGHENCGPECNLSGISQRLREALKEEQ